MDTRIQGLLIYTLLATFALPSLANELLDIRWNEGPNNTRVVLDLSVKADYKYGELDSPPRIYIDLKNTQRIRDIDVRELDSRIIKKIRHARQKGNTYRVVLDLEENIKPNIFPLPPFSPYGHRLVIDLPNDDDFKEEDCSTDKEPHKDVLIVLDAGHGGEDPGAVAINKKLEKHIVLSITKHTKQTIEAQPGFKVILTRDADYEVPLRARRDLALRERAHLFVSIHADSFTNSRPRGGSVFVLGHDAAETELTKWSQQNENRADWTGGVASWVNSECFDDPSLYGFVNELRADTVLDSSVDLGKSVLKFMGQVTRLHPRALTQNHHHFQVTDARYAVLKNNQVPAILVETGFLSNPDDAAFLSQAKNQKEVGRAIGLGVLAYFCEKPPHHTHLKLGALKCNIDYGVIPYLVRRGDTLSEIAQRYDVTVAAIQQLNQLGDSVNIFENQKLNLPSHASKN